MTCLVWFAGVTAGAGRPWCVKKPDGSVVTAAGVELLGNVRTLYHSDRFPDLPDSPRAVMLCDDVALTEPVAPW